MDIERPEKREGTGSRRVGRTKGTRTTGRGATTERRLLSATGRTTETPTRSERTPLTGGLVTD